MKPLAIGPPGERIAQLNTQLAEVREQRQRHLSADQRCDIIHVVLQLEMEAARENQLHPDRAWVFPRVRDRAHELLGYSLETISQVMRDWSATRECGLKSPLQPSPLPEACSGPTHQADADANPGFRSRTKGAPAADYRSGCPQETRPTERNQLLSQQQEQFQSGSASSKAVPELCRLGPRFKERKGQREGQN